MTYAVKEIFYTLQGEGANAGRPAVFCRFAGCNLACAWCDTDFTGGASYESAGRLADAIATAWPGGRRDRFVVLTGGEPAVQVDKPLIAALRERHFSTAIETNGTLPLKANVDWLCVSPKADSELAIMDGDELKLVFPQPGAEPERYEHLAFNRFYLQPMDAPGQTERNTLAALDYCRRHPQWRLSLQTHKLVGFP